MSDKWVCVPCPNRDAYEYRNTTTGEIRNFANYEIRHGFYGGIMRYGGIMGGVMNAGQSFSVNAANDQVNYLNSTYGRQTNGSLQDLMNQYQSQWTVKQPKKEEITMFGSVKQYFNQHKEIIMTLGFILIVDYLVFDGAFREKIKAVVERMLNSAEQKLQKLV